MYAPFDVIWESDESPKDFIDLIPSLRKTLNDGRSTLLGTGLYQATLHLDKRAPKGHLQS